MRRQQQLDAVVPQQLEQAGQHLADAISCATDLSHHMRLQTDVVYYWPPTFKDEEFEPARMECLNLAQMVKESPYVKQQVHGRARAVLQGGKEGQREAIVRVVCFPGLVAYRKGGGDLAKRELAAEGLVVDDAPPDVQFVRQVRDGKFTGLEGFRTRVLAKAVVHLQWGKQRLLTREAGTSTYLDAIRDGSNRYQENSAGFRQLWDICQETLGNA